METVPHQIFNINILSFTISLEIGRNRQELKIRKMRRCRCYNTSLLMALGCSMFAIYLVTLRMFGKDQRELDIRELERMVDEGSPVRIIQYDDVRQSYHREDEKVFGRRLARDPVFDRTMSYHRIWEWTNKVITRYELYPDTPDVDVVVQAMSTARIVHVDVLDIGEYESGTSEKWVVHLEGGIKAMAKLMWVLGFRNTPYVVGRKINLRKEILPVASTTVSKQILTKGNKTCVQGKCYFCQNATLWCPPDGVVEASLSYWVPRHLRLYTYPPKYMPYSTPNRKQWKHYGFNNKTYCEGLKKDFHPYEYPWYYMDLFDFAVLDTLMYHFDTKHYIIYDESDAQGLTVRLDHGRTFCNMEKDDYEIFMIPLIQCCTLRKSTWLRLKSLKGNKMTKMLDKYLSQDPLYPVLHKSWYPVLERRLKDIIKMIEKCAKANGGLENVLVDKED